MTTATERRMRRGFRSLLVLVALLLLADAARTPLLDPDEARFARTSVEMQRSGDRVVPQFEGQPRLVKPPLVHWIQSALFAAFGPREWVARLHSVAATVGLLALAGSIAARRMGEEGALWVGSFLATMPLVVGLGHVGTLDALLALHVFAFVALDLTGSDRESSVRSAASGAILGLAFLVKGPVGILLPLLIVLAGRTATGRSVVPSWRTVAAALLACIAVSAPWVAAFVDRLGWPAVLDVVTTESVERYFAADPGHRQPGWFFLGVAALGFAPWFLAAVAALPGLARPEGRGTVGRYAAAGVLVGLAFFTFAGGKRTSYVLPLAPLVALVAAAGLSREIADPARARWGSRAVVATTAAFAAAFAAAGTRLDGPLRLAAFVGAAIYAVATACCVWGFAVRRPRLVWGSAAAAGGLLVVVASLAVLPEVAERRSTASLAAAVPELGRAPRLAVVDMKVPSLTFYLDRVPELVDLADLERRVAVADGTVYVFDRRDVSRTSDRVSSVLREIGSHGKYRVFRRIDPDSRPPIAASRAR